MKFITELSEGSKVSDIYFCKMKNIAITKNGKEYMSLTLQDKTGTIDCKIWEINSMGIDDFDALDFVDVTGDVTVFNNALQLNIHRIRKASEGEYVESDYFPVSPYDIEKMWNALMTYVNSIKNPYLLKLLKRFFAEDSEFSERFKKHSAAKSVHHGFIGGLLQHSVSVASMCNYFAKAYPILDRDLLMTAALLHDMGKLWEISDFPENDYTDYGQLVGHIVIGSEKIGKVAKTIPNFPPVLLVELQHCILSHHGELEYGSPKKPSLIEAMALHLADDADAKIETMTELLDSKSLPRGEWYGYQRFLETNVRKTYGPNME